MMTKLSDESLWESILINQNEWFNALEEAYNRYFTVEVRQKIEEFKKETGDEFKSSRIEFLKQTLSEKRSELLDAYSTYKKLVDDCQPYILRGLVSDRIGRLEKELSKLATEIRILSLDEQSKITPEMIEIARERNIANFIELRRNKALCPFHPEKNPSFWVKGNRFYCFGCGAYGDAIDFVMRRDGLSFMEAVRYLNGKR